MVPPLFYFYIITLLSVVYTPLYAYIPFTQQQLDAMIVEIPVKETVRGFFTGNKFPIKATTVHAILGKKQYNADQVSTIRSYWMRSTTQKFKRGELVLVPHKSRLIHTISFIYGLILGRDSTGNYVIQIGDNNVMTLKGADIYKFNDILYRPN